MLEKWLWIGGGEVECECNAVGLNIERDRTPLNHGIISALKMTRWEIVADGYFVVLQIVVEHVVHAGITVFAAIVLEFAHYYAL